MSAADGFPMEAPETIGARTAHGMRETGSFFSQSEIGLTLLIFVFALLALGLFYLLVRTGKASPFLMRVYVIIILIFGTLLVVSSAYATDQIAPVVGFFGTIAGYLLGKSEKRDADIH